MFFYVFFFFPLLISGGSPSRVIPFRGFIHQPFSVAHFQVLATRGQHAAHIQRTRSVTQLVAVHF